MRFLQIGVFGQHGAFDNLHGYENPRVFADTLVKHATTYYGVAGRAYLEQLTQDTDTLTNCSQLLDTAMRKLVERFGTLSAQEGRAAKAFALVGIAGELAASYGITCWAEGIAFDAALTCFQQWRDHRGQGDTEALQIKELITAYLETYGDARFTGTTDDTKLHGMRSGYWRDDAEGRQW